MVGDESPGFKMEASVMTRTQWTAVAVGAACVIGASYLPGLADEGQMRMMHGQMQSGHGRDGQEEQGAHYLKHLLKHAKEIGLTPEQIGKLKALQLDTGRTQARLDADIKIANLELRDLLEDEQADLSVIKTKVDQLKYAEGADMLASIKAKYEGMALLTPEQREKDRAHREPMKKEGEGQHGGGMGGMGRGGMGGMGHGGMGGGGHGGQGSGDHGSGDSSGGQQHQR